ncbi:glycosyltransferase [Acinetobacter sp. YIM 103518]|uniref:Glycosyltransferase n=1 Tax=Acinetobacter faecalis TaxID=2665161 RepID=A0A6L6GDS7_9GAMM|nr:glycosyltransferase [Acinetobacter faecalis]MTD10596.1 glycosyltransferase [Acinetobacter faecalis]
MDKKRVIVLRNDILNYSETFILEQTRFYKKWDAILVGKYYVENGLNLDSIIYRLIPHIRDNFFQRWFLKITEIFWIKNIGIEKYIESLNADILYIHFGTDAVKFWPSIKDLHIPIYITLHGYDISIYKSYWYKGLAGNNLKNYPKRLLEIAKDSRVRFIAVSEAIKEKAILFGIPENKIFVHYIGVDTKKFCKGTVPIKKRENIILYIGRFTEKKAPLLLIRAFKQVVSQIPNAKLVMIGDGVLKSAAEELVKELNIPVVFKGVLSSEQIMSEMDKAKVYCLPSITAINGDSEGLPIANLEAISKGLPVVLTKHSGNVDIFDVGDFGAMVPENDLVALSDALINELNNMKEINLCDFNKKFDIRVSIDKLESFFEESLK